MKKRNYFLAIFATLLFFNFASALNATQDSLDVAVIPEFTQPTNVHMTISGATPGSYNIYTLTAVKILPSTLFYLNAGKNSLIFDVYPTTDLVAQGPTAYSFTYNLNSKETGENFEGLMSVRVVRFEDAFTLSSDSNSPDSDKMTFFIKNRENINLNNVHVKFTSLLFQVDETFNIKEGEKKEFSIAVDKVLLKKTEAGSYPLTAEVQTDRGMRTLEGRLIIAEKVGIESKEKTTGFFIRTTEVSKINYGNVADTVLVKIQKNVFTRLFTNFNIGPETVVRDGLVVTYSWNKKLMPTDSLIIKAKTNFLAPILVLLILVLLIIGFRRYTQTKLIIEKSVRPIKTKNGQFALKINLHLKAKRNIENVSLIDRIPGVVQIHEKFTSIIKPSKIDVKNRRIQWDLGNLRQGDERVFSYIVYSTVGVVGKFSLPRALAVFEKENEIHEVESNSVYFLTEQRAIDE